MAVDTELESWRRHWQTTSPIPMDLKSRVERETRRMRRWLAAEIIVTCVFGGGSVAWAVLSRRTDVLILAIGIWAFIAITWAIGFLLRRHAWAPAALSAAAFLDLSILRCKRRREAVIAQSVLYVMILSFDLAWIYFGNAGYAAKGAVSFLTSGRVGWVWVVTLVLAIAAARQRRRLARELDTLTKLREATETGLGEAAAKGGMRLWDLRVKSVKRSARKRRPGGWFAKS